jgi:hypothetical protein
MREGYFCSAKVEKTNRERCLRCWNYRDCENNLCSRCKKI